MLDALWIFGSGLLGSAHCLGMCGPFVVTIGAAAPTPMTNLRRQLTYSSGRIFTYVFLGCIAGFGGHRLTSSEAWRGWQSALAVVAGCVLITQGLKALGIGRPVRSVTSGGCSELKSVAGLLASNRQCDIFIAGLLTGFLPCGLLYAFVALAVSSASPWGGMLIMALFGLGTTPAMVLAGCAFGVAGVVLRRRLFAAAGLCAIVAGSFTVVRGARAYYVDSASPCPFCTGQVGG